MKCPLCKTELIKKDKPERFETFLEHVELCTNDENWIPELKEVFECSNEECEINHTGSFWDILGGFYKNNMTMKRLSYLKMKNVLKTFNAIKEKPKILSIKETVELLGSDPPVKCNLVESMDRFANRNNDKFKRKDNFDDK